MEEWTNEQKETALIVIGILIIVSMTGYFLEKRRKTRLYGQIYQALEKKSQLTMFTMKELVKPNQLPTNFDAKPYVKRLQNANGWFWDSDEDVKSIFCQELNAAQIAALAIRFEQITGKNLDAYLKNELFDDWFDEGKYDQIRTCIEAKAKIL